MSSEKYETSTYYTSVLSHKYVATSARGLRGEVEERGGVDAVASSTTKDKEIVRNPLRPQGWGGTALISLLLLLDDATASTRRRALTSEPSRSQLVLTYLWDRTLEPEPGSRLSQDGVSRRIVKPQLFCEDTQVIRIANLWAPELTRKITAPNTPVRSKSL